MSPTSPRLCPSGEQSSLPSSHRWGEAARQVQVWASVIASILVFPTFYWVLSSTLHLNTGTRATLKWVPILLKRGT